MTAQYLARQRSCVFALINHDHSVDDDSRDPCSVLMRVIKRRLICDLLWVKDGDIRAGALAQETTVYQSQSRGGSPGHFVERLGQ
jgi:hypothetical protein